MPARILLADDHQIVRQGLKALLEQKGYVVAGEAADGHEAIQLALRLRPDISILDLAMPLINGINVTREVLRHLPQMKVILLTMHTEEQYVFEALRAGCTGYVVKTDAATDLTRAIDAVQRGTTYVSSKISRAILQSYVENKGTAAVDPLTPREREVLQLIAEGKTTKEIATLLGISVKTGEAHRTKIMSKLGMHSIAGVVRYAIRHGMIEA